MKMNGSNTINNIHSVLSILPKLTKLTIAWDYNDWTRLFNDLRKSVSEFHASFAKINTEIKINYGSCNLFISKDHIVICDSDEDLETDLFELHWMSNLNMRSVRAVIEKFWVDPTILKFVNYCADRFDISVFRHLNLKCTTALEIISNGPITVNANVSEIFVFFV